MATPTGPAGGDLAGTYPNPTIAPGVLPTTLPPDGPAGGGLTGTYPNPTVAAVPDAALSANVPVMTAGVLPAVSGANLTNLPGPTIGKPGTMAFVGFQNLDVAGSLDVAAIGSLPPPVAPADSFQAIFTNGPTAPTGDLVISGSVISSTAGAADAGYTLLVFVTYYAS